MSVTKLDLAKHVAAQTAMTTVQVTRVMDALFQAIEAHLLAGEDVRLHHVGALKRSWRIKKRTRNPLTGAVTVTGKWEVALTPSRALEAALTELAPPSPLPFRT